MTSEINPIYSSRTADKFVVRLEPGMREQLNEKAKGNHRSMNSEILAAIKNHMGVERVITAHKIEVMALQNQIEMMFGVMENITSDSEERRSRGLEQAKRLVKTFRDR